ncbi:hypothetical protein AAG747_11945 [Rapidithrix thailandica]|uniref:Tetratricopeptide repeat protein n=1 Tax=Rapidithrix thailandica TaxID=413964 RepID=A0AAW9RXX6_9BACT
MKDQFNFEQFEEIESYLAGSLSQSKKEYFEQQMKKNKTLHEETSAIHSAQQLIKDYCYEEEVKESFQKMLREQDVEKRIHFGYYYMRLAAVFIAGLIVASIGIQFATIHPQDLLSDLQPYEASVKRGDVTAEASMQAAYQEQDYKTCLKLYQNLEAPTLQAQMLSAQAHFNLHQTRQAVQQFQGLRASDHVFYSQIAEWYLAFAYLETGEIKEAKQIFDSIKQNPDHLMHSEYSTWMEWKLKLLHWKS